MQYKIAGYNITEELYRSSRSLICRGIREEDQMPVVIKMLNQCHPSPEDIARFQYEYKITKELDIPGVIRVYDLEKVGNNPVIIMEDYGGRDLSRVIREGKGISLELFFKIAMGIVRILSGIHHQNVIHKDINPSNILWNPETEAVRIIDFALSTKLSRERQDIDMPNILEGSLPYISPEQTGRMNRVIDYRTDFYSLGVTFYELLTGVLPFSAEDTMGWVYCHIAKSPPHPCEKNPRIPSPVAEITLKLMSKNVEDRYQSSRGLLRDLEECREQWQEKRRIIDFNPGQRDISEKFQVSQKLYGREQEIAILLDTFEEVSRGNTELMLVSGYPGVGKSALVNEVRRPIVEKKGYFIDGKFDRFQHDIPYSVISQAFRGLVRQLLSEPEERLADWKEQLLKAFGPNGQVILDIIPEVEQIVGKQPPFQELNPTEAQNRLLLTFRDFVRVFAQAEHPLVIFLDNMQWSDVPTLTLLQRLMDSRDMKHLLLIGAFRDNEVKEGHPLLPALEEIQKHKPIRRISLKPLGEETVNRMIADTLFCELERSGPLARLIHQKTEGNPFFVNETLKKLYREGLLNFLHEQGRWSWDLGRINEIESSDNVVTFMIDRLKKFPSETQSCLSLAACIGNCFDLKTLSVISEETPVMTLKRLWGAVQEGVVVPLSDNYRLVYAGGEVPGKGVDREEPDFKVSFKFLHDRIQQAAYSMIGEGKKKEVHLSVGRLMLRRFNEKEREEKVIDIVTHLNEGRTLIGDDRERDELARLNLAAGKKAKSSNAYQAANRYLGIARKLLPENPWEGEQYGLTYEIYKEYSECCFLCGDFERAERLSKILLSRARTKLEKAEIHMMRLIQYSVKGEPGLAIEAGQAGLSLLGIRMAAKPGKLSIIRELIRVKMNLRNRDIADLANQPMIEDPEQLLSLKILMALCSPAYLSGNKNLYTWVVLKQTFLSLLHGNCPESAFAYAVYGAILGFRFNDLKTGFEFGKLAVNLCERFDNLELRCQTLFVYSHFIHSWNRHRKTLTPYFKKVIEAGYQTGDLIYMGYACTAITEGTQELDLNTAVKEGKHYLSIITETKYYDNWAFAKLSHQFRLNLLGLTNNRLSLNDDTFDEAECLGKMTQTHSLLGIAIFYVIKSQLDLFYENYPSALNHVREMDKVIEALLGVPYSVSACLAVFFTFASQLPQMPAREKKKAWKRLKKGHKQMKRWSDHCPVNFLHHRLLMEAEMARLSGKIIETQRLYDQAIEAAQTNGFLRYEAFANELAAKFYRAQDQVKFASLYMKEAHYCYKRWGAAEKVRHLEENYPDLLEQKTSQEPYAVTGPSLADISTAKEAKEALDFEAVSKAAQTLSGEMNLEKLLEKLMRIARENAGAEKAFLLLRDESSRHLLIQAESIGDCETRVKQSQKPEDNHQLSAGIVRYVERSLKVVVLGDAANKGDFTRDPYIQKHRPRSVLCMPIVNQGRLVGILYLENNVTGDVFPADGLEVLGILASQAAISIENAGLYASLEKKVAERTRELNSKNRVLETLDDIVRAINTEVCLDDLLHAILRETMVIKGVEKAAAAVRDMDSDLFRVKASLGFNPQDMDMEQVKGTQEEVEARYIKGSLQIHEDIFIAKEMEKRPFFERVRHLPLAKATLVNRIRVDNRPEAYFIFTNTQDEDAFDDQDILLLKNLKEHIVAAFQKTRLITRLREAMENLEKKHLQLINTQSQLTQAEKMAGLGTLVAGVAHEINNPTNFTHASAHNLDRDLRKLKEFLLELAGDEADDEVLAAFDEKFDTLFNHLVTMQEGTNRIKNIVTELRTFSRLGEAEMEPVHLVEGLQITAHLVEANYRDQVAFVYDFQADPEVECYPGELNQVFMNIMVNACQAILKKQKKNGDTAKGTLTIQTREEEGHAVIRFEDTGTGMSEEVQRKIFDPFFTTKTVGEGTGLGLSISFSIIQKHRGRIDVWSEEGKGTTVTLYIPLEREQASTIEPERR